ncbi:BMP family lipoprotein [Wenjunlia tyrosinilytica]|uniref:BMP family ABC transporter substrate-binding protein n=1 Tax=Wenjunlia tyrosinilytica TaxID=1544741 RepID=A0A918DU00_9ACTN|nr:BMP family ABC transporter substrate-binding protein [Wenjunlia tyrosinilytica]GGO83261.1 BMP family ABC transporter substrate-binding protein [Wenjunlia tyrosinilytica]
MRQVTKLAAVTLVGALALTATACGGSSSSSKSSGDKGVGLAFDVGGRGDNSFNDASYAGMQKAMDEFHIKGKSLTPREGESEDDKVQRLVQLAKEGYNPVVGVGVVYSGAVKKVSQQFPKTSFAVIDAADNKGPNIANLVFTEEQSSYLVGVAAALQTKTNTVGFIGGVKFPLIQKFEAGFVQGVHDTNPKVKVLVKYLASPPNFSKGFGDPTEGANAAKGQLDSKADVIYSAAGASGDGAIKVISQSGKTAWAIGVDKDQYKQPSLAPYKKIILTSAMKDAEGAVYNFVKSVVKDKKPQVGVVPHSLSDGGVDYAKSNPTLTDNKAAVDKIEAAKKKIINGEIKVRTTP